jgi:hypothetical protein
VARSSTGEILLDPVLYVEFLVGANVDIREKAECGTNIQSNRQGKRKLVSQVKGIVFLLPAYGIRRKNTGAFTSPS